MPDTGPLDFPHSLPVDSGPRWLPYKPPPLGEWIFSELASGEHKSWMLRIYPIFEAQIYWYGGEFQRYHLKLNGTDFGHFRNLSVAMQRAEKDILDRVRQIMPVLAIVRRRLRNSPMAHEPQESVRVIKTRMPKREPLIQCGCGAIANDKTQIWAVEDYKGRKYLSCYKCLPADMKAIVDEPIGGQGCTSLASAKCECLREAVFVEGRQAYCEECRPRQKET